LGRIDFAPCQFFREKLSATMVAALSVWMQPRFG
jgi:hypothetical protein